MRPAGVPLALFHAEFRAPQVPRDLVTLKRSGDLVFDQRGECIALRRFEDRLNVCLASFLNDRRLGA